MMAIGSVLRKDLNVLKRLFQMVYVSGRAFAFITLFRSLLQAAIPLINVIMPACIIDEMVGSARWNVLVAYAFALAGGNILLGWLRVYLEQKWELSNKQLQHELEMRLGKHIMELDYERIEDSTVLDLKERAIYPVKNQNSLNEMIETVCNIFTALLSLVSLSAVLVQAGFVLLLGIFLFCVIQFRILINIQGNMSIFYKKLPVGMRRSIYYENIASDYKPLKEIQLYRGKELLLDKLKKAHESNVELFTSSFSKNGIYEGLMGAVSQIQLIFVYIYNIIMLFLGKISVGNFTMYVNAASKLSENMLLIIKGLVIIHQDCGYLSVYLQFMNLKNGIKEEEKRSEDVPEDGKFTIEFKDVSFRYPNQNEMVLRHISVVIRPGEKVAVVGMNGAGKTTFIKLICRLLNPTEGEICLNGVNINRYSEISYRRMVSTVFQDFRLFSFTIQDNIDISRTGKGIGSAVRQAGIEEWVKKCPNKELTQITRRFDEKGVEPSGGEGQNLAIARAIHKNAPIMILDEPTAALDPYTEYEIYTKFNEISEGKTVIYISHRLGCCQFCDRILLFENGLIAEQGNHEELRRAGGKYEKMWKAQSKYYDR